MKEKAWGLALLALLVVPLGVYLSRPAGTPRIRSLEEATSLVADITGFPESNFNHLETSVISGGSHYKLSGPGGVYGVNGRTGELEWVFQPPTESTSRQAVSLVTARTAALATARKFYRSF